MDYTKLTEGLHDKIYAAVALINNPEIAPEIRQLNQEILFREVGQAVYTKVYDMNAFDFEIEHTVGPGIDDRYYGLAKVTSDSISAGNLGLTDLIKNYVDSMAAMAQRDATANALQSGKHPKVTRSLVGAKNCDWCKSLTGTYTDPPKDIFLRHKACDCRILTEGYKSRNGLLKNYVKPQDR